MATTLKQTAYGTSLTLLTTELNGLAAGAQIVSSVGGAAGVYDNSTNNDILVDLRLACTFAVAPVALTTVDVYFLRLVDGSTPPDGSTTTPQPQLRRAWFEARAVTTAQIMDCYDVALPPGKWKIVAINTTAQALGATGNVLTAVPHDMQSV